MTPDQLKTKFVQLQKIYPWLKKTKINFAIDPSRFWPFYPYGPNIEDVGGEYIPLIDRISINPDFPFPEFVLMHEVRHVMQFKLKLKKYGFDKVTSRYGKYGMTWRLLENDANKFAERETGIKYQDLVDARNKQKKDKKYVSKFADLGQYTYNKLPFWKTIDDTTSYNSYGYSRSIISPGYYS